MDVQQLDCLLINPADPPATYPPLGICYLAAVARNEGISVDICDRPSNNWSYEKIVREIKKHRPKIVGLTVMSALLKETYEIIEQIRLSEIETTIVVGGPYINIEPEIIVDMGVKYAFRGDVELSFPDFCRYLINGEEPPDDLPGIVINRDGEIIKNPPALHPDLNSLPMPAYDLLDMHKYMSTTVNYRTVSMITARGGCPYQCTFCGNMLKEKYRYLETDYILDQLEHFEQEMNMELVEFVDETFTLNKKKIELLCNGIIERGVSLKWVCLTRVDRVDYELLKLMREAGCYLIRFGVESGTEKIRFRAKKYITDERYMEVINQCRELGIKTLCFYIFGHPEETAEEMRYTIDFSIKMGSDTIAYSKMEPIPNSEIFDLAVKEGKVPQNVWTLYMKGEHPYPIYYPDTVEPKVMEKVYKEAYLKYYTSFRTFRHFMPMFLKPAFWYKALNFINILAFGNKNLP